jgi:hypothetical protein
MLHNEAYYHAAYIVAMGIYALYALSIWVRRRAVRRRLEGRPEA